MNDSTILIYDSPNIAPGAAASHEPLDVFHYHLVKNSTIKFDLTGAERPEPAKIEVQIDGLTLWERQALERALAAELERLANGRRLCFYSGPLAGYPDE